MCLFFIARELNKPMFFCRAAGCGLSFRLNAALQKHLVQRHSSRPTGQPYGCDVCDKKFIKEIYLTHHKLRYHHDTMQRDFVCDVSPGAESEDGAPPQVSRALLQ